MNKTYLLDKLPDVDFIENQFISDLQKENLKEYNQAYKEITGEEISLTDADRDTIILNAIACMHFQIKQQINEAAKQNFIKFSTMGNLDNLGAFRGATRLEESKAITMIKFTLSEVQNKAIVIPKGTRVTDGEIYFSTTERSEIQSGKLEIDVIAECDEAGTIGNNIEPGRISMLVDLIPFIDKVSNVTNTAGGADPEADEDYADRIYQAPQGYSTAGPSGAYEFHTKAFSPLVSDVRVLEPSPGVVDVRVLLQNGNLADEAFLHELENHLSTGGVRPLNDKVLVGSPEQIEYDIELEYFISKDDMSREEEIKGYVENSVAEYVEWQKSKIGKDINPSYLMKLLMECGIKRVNIINPVFTKIDNSKVAICSDSIKKNYGGLEDE